jgi:D-lactate dehydrogenase
MEEHMEKVTIAFFDTKPYDREFFSAADMNDRFDITWLPARLTRDTVSLAAGHTVVCAFVNDELDAFILETLSGYGIELIAMRCAGYNNVDLKAAWKKIHVVRVPAYSPYAVAEHAVALMLTLNRKIHKAYNRTRDNNFAITGLLGFDMHGKTAGVIGTGTIGRILIGLLRGFGMKVLAYDKFPDRNYAVESGFDYVELPELYSRSDIISLHCPLTSETVHMINNKTIDTMKKGVMIINTGRGNLIDTRDLIEGLKNGKIGYAGLDVYEEESDYFFEDFSTRVVEDDVLARLLTFPNVCITSHQGFFTNEALSAIASTTLENIAAWYDKKDLFNEVCYHCDKPDCRRDKHGSCW